MTHIPLCNRLQYCLIVSLTYFIISLLLWRKEVLSTSFEPVISHLELTMSDLRCIPENWEVRNFTPEMLLWSSCAMTPKINCLPQLLSSQDKESDTFWRFVLYTVHSTLKDKGAGKTFQYMSSTLSVFTRGGPCTEQICNFLACMWVKYNTGAEVSAVFVPTASCRSFYVYLREPVWISWAGCSLRLRSLPLAGCCTTAHSELLSLQLSVFCVSCLLAAHTSLWAAGMWWLYCYSICTRVSCMRDSTHDSLLIYVHDWQKSSLHWQFLTTGWHPYFNTARRLAVPEIERDWKMTVDGLHSLIAKIITKIKAGCFHH